MTDKKNINTTHIFEKFNRIQSSIDKTLEPYCQMQQALQPQIQLQEAMRKALQPQIQLQEAMRKALQPQLQLQETVRKALESHDSIQKQMARILSPISKTSINASGSFKSYNDLFQDVKKQINSFNSVLSEPLVSKIEIVEDNKISLEDKTISIDELIDSYTSFFLDKDFSNAFEYLNAFANWIESLSRVTKVIAIYLFLPYLISVVANITTPMLVEHLPLGQNQTDIFKISHYTTASILNVRSAGDIESEIIDELKFGSTVHVIEKRKKWCLIEYSDSITGTRSRGWVFSRYLSKFEK